MVFILIFPNVIIGVMITFVGSSMSYFFRFGK